MNSKKEKIVHSKNSGNTLKLVKNKRISNSNGKKRNNNIKTSKDNNNKQKGAINSKEKNLNKIGNHNFCESSEKYNLITINNIFETKHNNIKKIKSNSNIKNKLNSTHKNKNYNVKNQKIKKLITFQDLNKVSKQKNKPNDEMSERPKQKEFKIENIFNYPVKYINNNINFNNYISNNKTNTNNNYEIIGRNSFVPCNEKNNKKKLKNIKKNGLNENKENKEVGKNDEKKLLNKILSEDDVIKNDTVVKYINNDSEDITESNNRDLENKYKKEKIINIKDDIDKCFKIVDSLNNEEDDYKHFFNADYYNLKDNNNEEKIIFDDELSSISSHPQPRKKMRKKHKKKKKKNSIKKASPKSESKKENINTENEKEYKYKDNYEKDFYPKMLKNEKKDKNNTFNNLINNKTFKKFLKYKIKYYVDENEIPVKFINSLSLRKNKNIIPNKYNKIIKDEDHFMTYDNFYDSREESQIKECNNIENKKDLERKNKNQNLIEIPNYKKLECDNLRKSKEIENLKEELKNQKIMMDEKKEIINELKNINQNLEKQVSDLTYKFIYDKVMKKNNNSNSNLIRKNKILDFFNEQNKNITDLDNKKKLVQNLKEDNKRDNKENSSIFDELIRKKNKLIQIRKETNDEYFNLSNKKENLKYRNFLEQKLDKINNSLMKIRINLKKLNY